MCVCVFVCLKGLGGLNRLNGPDLDLSLFSDFKTIGTGNLLQYKQKGSFFITNTLTARYSKLHHSTHMRLCGFACLRGPLH